MEPFSVAAAGIGLAVTCAKLVQGIFTVKSYYDKVKSIQETLERISEEVQSLATGLDSLEPLASALSNKNNRTQSEITIWNKLELTIHACGPLLERLQSLVDGLKPAQSDAVQKNKAVIKFELCRDEVQSIRNQLGSYLTSIELSMSSLAIAMHVSHSSSLQHLQALQGSQYADILTAITSLQSRLQVSDEEVTSKAQKLETEEIASKTAKHKSQKGISMSQQEQQSLDLVRATQSVARSIISDAEDILSSSGRSAGGLAIRPSTTIDGILSSAPPVDVDAWRSQIDLTTTPQSHGETLVKTPEQEQSLLLPNASSPQDQLVIDVDKDRTDVDPFEVLDTSKPHRGSSGGENVGQGSDESRFASPGTIKSDAQSTYWSGEIGSITSTSISEPTALASPFRINTEILRNVFDIGLGHVEQLDFKSAKPYLTSFIKRYVGLPIGIRGDLDIRTALESYCRSCYVLKSCGEAFDLLIGILDRDSTAIADAVLVYATFSHLAVGFAEEQMERGNFQTAMSALSKFRNFATRNPVLLPKIYRAVSVNNDQGDTEKDETSNHGDLQAPSTDHLNRLESKLKYAHELFSKFTIQIARSRRQNGELDDAEKYLLTILDDDHSSNDTILDAKEEFVKTRLARNTAVSLTEAHEENEVDEVLLRQFFDGPSLTHQASAVSTRSFNLKLSQAALMFREGSFEDGERCFLSIINNTLFSEHQAEKAAIDLVECRFQQAETLLASKRYERSLAILASISNSRHESEGAAIRASYQSALVHFQAGDDAKAEAKCHSVADRAKRSRDPNLSKPKEDFYFRSLSLLVRIYQRQGRLVESKAIERMIPSELYAQGESRGTPGPTSPKSSSGTSMEVGLSRAPTLTDKSKKEKLEDRRRALVTEIETIRKFREAKVEEFKDRRKALLLEKQSSQNEQIMAAVKLHDRKNSDLEFRQNLERLRHACEILRPSKVYKEFKTLFLDLTSKLWYPNMRLVKREQSFSSMVNFLTACCISAGQNDRVRYLFETYNAKVDTRVCVYGTGRVFVASLLIFAVLCKNLNAVRLIVFYGGTTRADQVLSIGPGYFSRFIPFIYGFPDHSSNALPNEVESLGNKDALCIAWCLDQFAIADILLTDKSTKINYRAAWKDMGPRLSATTAGILSTHPRFRNDCMATGLDLFADRGYFEAIDALFPNPESDIIVFCRAINILIRHAYKTRNTLLVDYLEKHVLRLPKEYFYGIIRYIGLFRPTGLSQVEKQMRDRLLRLEIHLISCHSELEAKMLNDMYQVPKSDLTPMTGKSWTCINILMCDYALTGSVEYLGLLAEVFGINWVNPSSGRAAIHLPFATEQVTELLLTFGASTDVRDRNSLTPLHTAVILDEPGRLNILLDYNAKIGDRVLGEDYSTSGGNGRVTAQDSQSAGDLSSPASWMAFQKQSKKTNGFTALHIAAALGRLEIAVILANRGASINAYSHYGETPLLVAVRRGHKEVAKKLADLGADVPLDVDETTWELLATRSKNAANAPGLACASDEHQFRGDHLPVVNPGR
ncbi:MAG: hypothetical protein M1814_001956 [Vezdaea aestivalis]|nr:MAG: hypothetical protein M1814_001956 [Vezdaea aestivalis]